MHESYVLQLPDIYKLAPLYDGTIERGVALLGNVTDGCGHHGLGRAKYRPWFIPQCFRQLWSAWSAAAAVGLASTCALAGKSPFPAGVIGILAIRRHNVVGEANMLVVFPTLWGAVDTTCAAAGDLANFLSKPPEPHPLYNTLTLTSTYTPNQARTSLSCGQQFCYVGR